MYSGFCGGWLEGKWAKKLATANIGFNSLINNVILPIREELQCHTNIQE